MSWRFNRYKTRPPSNCKAARIAWDEMTKEAAALTPPRAIARLWYAPEMYAWAAFLDGVDAQGHELFLEMDVLEVADRVNNPHKYAIDEPVNKS